MKFMLIWRYNRLKYLVKLAVQGNISNSEYINESEIIRNEIYQLELMEVKP